MKVKILGAADTVTGSKHLIETKVSQYLIDCGLYQGPPKLEKRNNLEF